MSIAACEKVSHVLVAEVRHILLDPVTTVGNMPGERGEREREGGEERNGALHGEVAANTVVTIRHLLLKKQVTISLHNSVAFKNFSRQHALYLYWETFESKSVGNLC